MQLTAGTRLGPYEITGALGAGGMGEVTTFLPDGRRFLTIKEDATPNGAVINVGLSWTEELKRLVPTN